MNGPALLLVAEGGAGADFIHACGLPVEQALYIRFRPGDDWLVVPRLELERARRSGRAAHIVERGEVGWAEGPDPYSAWASTAAGLLRREGASRVTVSPLLPAAYYARLLEAGVEVDIDRGLLVAERRRKSEAEIGHIEAAQRAAEAACVAVIAALAEAEAGPGGYLELGGGPLTSERLMARAQVALNERGHSAAEMIVAGSPDCALPHFLGAGPIRAGAPVIIDIFPRGLESHYHGDLTRTVVAGVDGIGSGFARMHAAAVAAMDAAEPLLRPGADGRAVHRAACAALVEAGFGTTTPGYEGNPGGPTMTHSLGHGVGLDVHEAPNLRDLDYPLAEGDVVTVEPGLYQVGLGGVRVEDLGVITAAGFRNLTTLPRSLDPRDYL